MVPRPAPPWLPPLQTKALIAPQGPVGNSGKFKDLHINI